MSRRASGLSDEGLNVVELPKREPVEPVPRRPRRRGWRILLCGLAGVLALVVLGFGAVWLLDMQRGIARVPALLDRAKPYFVAVHFALIGLLWWRWDVLIHWMFRRRWIHADNVKLALAMRVRVVAFFLAFEFLVVLRWPFALLHP